MRRAGFTLVELLVGLTLAGLAVLIAAEVYLVTTGTLGRLAARSESLDRRALASSWLTQTLASADVSSESAFRGSTDSLSFSSSVWVPRGWLEERRVTVGTHSSALRLHVDGEHPVVLLDSIGSTRFEYRGDLGGAAPWLPRWNSFSSPPLAVRLRYTDMRSGARDTALFLVGDRG